LCGVFFSVCTLSPPPPPWPAKVWSIVLALAAFFVLWVAFAFNLIGFGLYY
jgi:hypothetical protein